MKSYSIEMMMQLKNLLNPSHTLYGHPSDDNSETERRLKEFQSGATNRE